MIFFKKVHCLHYVLRDSDPLPALYTLRIMYRLLPHSSVCEQKIQITW